MRFSKYVCVLECVFIVRRGSQDEIVTHTKTHTHTKQFRIPFFPASRYKKVGDSCIYHRLGCLRCDDLIEEK